MIKYDSFKSYHKEHEATGNLEQWSLIAILVRQVAP